MLFRGEGYGYSSTVEVSFIFLNSFFVLLLKIMPEKKSLLIVKTFHKACIKLVKHKFYQTSEHLAIVMALNLKSAIPYKIYHLSNNC